MQEVEEEVKSEIVTKLLQRGINVQELADWLSLDEDVITKIAEELQTFDSYKYS